MESIRVAVTGACGRMGREVVKAVNAAPDMQLVLAVDRSGAGEDVGSIALDGPIGLAIQPELTVEALKQARAQVLVEFTHFSSAPAHAAIALQAGVSPVIGASGLSQQNLADLKTLAEQAGVAALFIANFAIGAVLMMRFAREAARYLPNVEIIELHHDGKRDAPSQTAVRTAELVAEARTVTPPAVEETIKMEGARGARHQDVPIHSVRLPGFVAHQEVIFGGVGEALTIRHDSINRESFMPGVLLAVRKAGAMKGLVIGLDPLMDS